MPDDDAKIERLTDLILTLLNTSTPMPLSEIAAEVPGYPEGHEARRQAFERDKRLLREEGIWIEAISVEGSEQFGYRIDPATFFLPDLGLEPDEQAALNLAVAGVHLGDDSGGEALRKLGLGEIDEVTPIASLGVVAGLDRLFQALAVGAEVRFSYRGEQRTVCPIRLLFSGGHWYLAGFSRERSAGRSFRVDRIQGEVALGAPGSATFESDEEISLDFVDEPWGSDATDENVTVLRISVDASHAWLVVDEVGEEHVVERGEDEGAIIEIPVARFEAARSWLLSHLDHIEILSPSSWRGELIEWLEAIERRPIPSDPPPTVDELTSEGSATTQERSVPRTQRRLRRLLAMLEWLASVGTTSTNEVAERFGMTADEVVQELELAACCGRPPYSPAELMDIIVDADTVTARLPEMSQHRQLTAQEGVALAAAARTILAMPGADPSGPLSRSLGKLDAALGDRAAIEVDLPSPPMLGALTSAADEHRRLRVEYLAASTDELTERVIDPIRVMAIDGRWYVDAFCHRAGERRTFRADSFKEIEDLGPQPDTLPPTESNPEPFTPSADAEVAIITVGSSCYWVADSIPVIARREEPDGGATVAIHVASRTWLGRLLLQAGPDAAVRAPESMHELGHEMARRVLGRYRPTM